MKRFAAACSVLTLALALGSTDLTAQSGSLAGAWACEFGNTHPTQRIYNWSINFGIQLAPDGSFQTQGQYYASSNGIWDPFAAEGQWWVEGGQIKFHAHPVFARSGHAVPFQWTLNIEGEVLRIHVDSEYGSLRSMCTRAG